MTSVDTSSSADEVRALVIRHRVVWELRPAYVMTDRGKVEIGFDVELYGTHTPTSHPSPGCPECIAVWEAMRTVALAALPRDHRDSVYNIERFQPAFHYAPARQSPGAHDRADVQLTISVRHREGFLDDVDPCEERCSREIVDNLRRLGVPEHVWRRR